MVIGFPAPNSCLTKATNIWLECSCCFALFILIVFLFSHLGSQRSADKPPLSPARLIAQIVFAIYFSLVFHHSIPNAHDITDNTEELPEFLPIFLYLLSKVMQMIGIALAIYLVGSVGNQTGSKSTTMIGAFVGELLSGVLPGTSILVPLIAFNTTREFRLNVYTTQPKNSLLKRIALLWLSCFSFLLLIISGVWFKVEVVTAPDQQMKVFFIICSLIFGWSNCIPSSLPFLRLF